jgi:hypothetical protein
MMVFIYILLLQSHKYYIGKTTNPIFRISDHFNSNGSEWTKIHTPITIEEIIPDCDPYDEDKYTLKYMETKGIDNVRGGSFSQIKLSDEQTTLIEQMIKGATDKCYSCSASGHFVKECMEPKLHEYIKLVTNENVEEKTDLVRSIYDEIIEINKIIQRGEFVSMSDLPEIRKQSKELNEEKTLQYEYDNLRKQRTLNIHGEPQLNITKMNPISNRLQQLKQVTHGIPNWKNSIPAHYRTHFTSGSVQDIPHGDIVIFALDIIKSTVKAHQKLRRIYKTYHSEEFVKELLIRLLTMEISVIEPEYEYH